MALPQGNNVDTIIALLDDRFGRLDTKLDDMRKELMAAFVLKQVFDIAAENMRADILELRKELADSEARTLAGPQRIMAVYGGLVGALAGIFSMLHMIGVIK